MVQNLSLVAFTAMANPMIMSNWKHLLPGHPEVHCLHDQLMDDLKKVAEEVDALNTRSLEDKSSPNEFPRLLTIVPINIDPNEPINTKKKIIYR